MKKLKLIYVVSIFAFSILLVACGTNNSSSNAKNEGKPEETSVKNEWAKIDDKYYFYAENGKVVKDDYIEDTYYVDKNGVMVRNTWHKDKNNGKYYYFSDDGKCEMSKWINYNGDWFYLDNTGAMVTNGWVESLYYVDNEGKMLKNTITPDGYYVDENGRYRSQQELNQITANVGTKSNKEVILNVQSASTSRTELMQELYNAIKNRENNLDIEKYKSIIDLEKFYYISECSKAEFDSDGNLYINIHDWGGNVPRNSNAVIYKAGGNKIFYKETSGNKSRE